MKYKLPIKHCKICFKEYKLSDFCRLFDPNIAICAVCQRNLNPLFINFDVDGYKTLSIYEYNAFIKDKVYLFKGCFDYEMSCVFLNLFISELRMIYKSYYIVPVPSYAEDNERRGFNHVIEVFKLLNLPMLDIIEKTKPFKQAKNSGKKRKDIRKFMKLTRSDSLEGKRILIVDDIYTTGSTIKSVINLIEKLNPKDIKVLVLAKTKGKQP